MILFMTWVFVFSLMAPLIEEYDRHIQQMEMQLKFYQVLMKAYTILLCTNAHTTWMLALEWGCTTVRAWWVWFHAVSYKLQFNPKSSEFVL